ncbi:uncharacterized protein LOC132192898 [Neocloeon triangulifer]|uniref:uncharacterized protein LOC132192898 n=1 Tax=Neocloeon triangulifer TaxID=2078957 RepID=UPI00286F869D|nr:uncharacterized protein LOC132192898 [Neocloeon triangulifer]
MSFPVICVFCLLVLAHCDASDKIFKSNKCGGICESNHKHSENLGRKTVDEPTSGSTILGRGVRPFDPILALILALQVKILLALPLFLLAAGLIGLKSLAASLVSAFLSGASLLRSLLPTSNSNNSNRPSGASSRVAYEVRSGQPQQDFTPYVYPPSALGVLPAARQPDLRVISAAANN